MVQGMAFLSKKGFNPQNQVNRKQVWEAQQQSKLEKERVRKREEQLKREREDEELCAARHNGDGSQAQLRFMYDAPPGMNKEEKTHVEGSSKSGNELSPNVNDVTQVQPGDDAAAAAFRRMLAASSKPTCTEQLCKNDEIDTQGSKLGFAPVLQGSTQEPELEKSDDMRSALEKAVGRKDRGGALTLEEQVARFPQLKNAPMAKGMSVTDVNVSFKPLGAQLRNVKCLACGVWGHSRGDRECKMTGWDPFSLSNSRHIGAVGPSSIRPSNAEKRINRNDDQSDDDRTSGEGDSDYSSSSSSRRHRKRKHRSKRERRHKHSSRKRSRRNRSESPSRRSKSRKSHKKKRHRRYD